MTATNEELALLEKWKRKLCLQEWRSGRRWRRRIGSA